MRYYEILSTVCIDCSFLPCFGPLYINLQVTIVTRQVSCWKWGLHSLKKSLCVSVTGEPHLSGIRAACGAQMSQIKHYKMSHTFKRYYVVSLWESTTWRTLHPWITQMSCQLSPMMVRIWTDNQKYQQKTVTMCLPWCSCYQFIQTKQDWTCKWDKQTQVWG